jgi:type IV secretion system protein VirB4
LLILDEAWLFLENSTFASKIREWLKTLRKKNTAVLFATQSLADIAQSSIATAIIESCPTRIFLPNPAAFEQSTRELYASFGLNDRQLSILQTATPKRDYYYQSASGSRLFQLGLGPMALAFCGAGAPKDQATLTRLYNQSGPKGFAEAYLHEVLGPTPLKPVDAPMSIGGMG